MPCQTAGHFTLSNVSSFNQKSVKISFCKSSPFLVVAYDYIRRLFLDVFDCFTNEVCYKNSKLATIKNAVIMPFAA